RWGPNNPNAPAPPPGFANNCGPDVLVQLQITNSPQCFSCTLTSCPAGSIPQNEFQDCPNANLNYVDSTNRGCHGETAQLVQFTPISCGTSVCGAGSTFRFNKPCNVPGDCDLGDDCTNGSCTGSTDNEQDWDYYEVSVTSPKRITWSVTSTF